MCSSRRWLSPKSARATANGSSDSIRHLNFVVMLPAELHRLTPFLTQRLRQRPEQGPRAPAHLPGCLPSPHPHLANRETPRWTCIRRQESEIEGQKLGHHALERAPAEIIFSQNPRSTVMYVPFVWIMWGTTGGMSKASLFTIRGHFH